MSLQSFGGSLYVPEYPAGVNTAMGVANVTVDADAEGIACVFQSPVTGTITGFGLATGTVLTTGDAGMEGRLEGVDVSATPAKPSGSLIAAGASGTMNITTASTWYNVVLGTPYAATKGEMLAVVVRRPTAGSFSGTFRVFSDETGTSSIFPLSLQNAGAGWVATGVPGAPMFAVNYGGTYHQIGGVWPFLDVTPTAFGNSATPDVRGNLWIPRTKVRVTGLWVWADLDAAALIKFYDTDGVTVLAACTAGANYRSVGTGGLIRLPFDSLLGAVTVTPTVGATYRIGVEPATTTNMSIYEFSVGAAAIMGAFGFGTNMHKTTAKDPSGVGSWTDDATARFMLGVTIDQGDDGVSAGGGGGVISRSLIAGGG